MEQKYIYDDLMKRNTSENKTIFYKNDLFVVSIVLHSFELNGIKFSFSSYSKQDKEWVFTVTIPTNNTKKKKYRVVSNNFF